MYFTLFILATVSEGKITNVLMGIPKSDIFGSMTPV